MQIKKTKQYDRFKFFKGNRPTKRTHIVSLKKSIQEDDLTEYCPILVNNKDEIVDGQHRYLACKELGMPIYYRNTNTLGLETAQRLSSNTKGWSYEDFLESFIVQGMEDYITFKEFRKRWFFSIGDCIMLFTPNRKTQVSHSNYKQFKEGNFKVISLNQAVKRAKRIYDFKPFYPSFKRRSFVKACLLMFANPDYQHSLMLKKMAYQSSNLLDCINTQQYLRAMERIYNFKTSPEDKIRLY